MTPIKTLAAVLLLGSSLAATAETIESVEYKYYLISPQSPWTIKPELMRYSPIRDRRGSFNGHTDWYIDWYFRPLAGPYGCKLADIKINVRVVHTLPALSEHVTDKQTIEVFNRFSEALTEHEKNHGNNGLQAAREIDRAFQALPPQRDCRSLTRMAEEAGKAIVQKYIQKDNEYDYMTRNGETEGAVIY